MRYKTPEDHTMPIMDYAEVQKKKKLNDGCRRYWVQMWWGVWTTTADAAA